MVFNSISRVLLGGVLSLCSAIAIAHQGDDYDRRMCESHMYGRCLDMFCMNSSQLDCNQNCHHWAKKHCIHPRTFDMRDCRAMKKNECLTLVCPNSQAIDCPEQCDELSKSKCDEMLSHSHP